MGNLHAVIFKQGDWWVAHCLEVDLATQAKSVGHLSRELADLLSSHIALSRELGVEPFHGLPPAPKRYWEMFDAAPTRLEPVVAAAPSNLAPAFEARLAA
jgi:hypothetical protein